MSFCCDCWYGPTSGSGTLLGFQRYTFTGVPTTLPCNCADICPLLLFA